MNPASVSPDPPIWALAAGLPAPLFAETFGAYCIRLGINIGPLLEELTPRTACMANRRLTHYLSRKMPRPYKAHVEEWLAQRLDPARRRELQRFAENFFPRGS